MPTGIYHVLIAAWKGCAVGCTIHSSKHSDYELEFGLLLVGLFGGGIFEGLSNGEAKISIKFLEAIPVGVSMGGLMHEFLSVFG